MGSRIAVFFSSATLAGAFSEFRPQKGTYKPELTAFYLGGLLAAAISNMNGIGGKTGHSISLTNAAQTDRLSRVAMDFYP